MTFTEECSSEAEPVLQRRVDGPVPEPNSRLAKLLFVTGKGSHHEPLSVDHLIVNSSVHELGYFVPSGVIDGAWDRRDHIFILAK